MLPSEHALRLINWLASATREDLEYLASRRALLAADFHSLVTLAGALSDPQRTELALSRVDRSGLETLVQIAAGDRARVDPELARLGFVDDRADPPKLLVEASVIHRMDLSAAEAPTVSPRPIGGDDPRSHAAGTQVETLLCGVQDLIDVCTREPLGATKDGQLNAHALQLLRERLGEIGDTAALIRLSRHAGLIDLEHQRFLTSAKAEHWLAAARIDQWRHLASSWWEAQPEWLRRILTLHPGCDWSESIPALIAYHYPLLDTHASWEGQSIEAGLLGLIVQADVTAFGMALWGGGMDDLAALLPAYSPGVYAMEDFTLLAPGPISPEHRLTLDALTSKELGGLVPRYRVTGASIQRALRAGEPPETILERLREVSMTPLPDAVVWLVDDIIHHSGRIALWPAGTGTRIELADALTADALDADPALAILPRTRTSETELVSPWPLERVYSALESARYASSIPPEFAVARPARSATQQESVTGVRDAIDALVTAIEADTARGVPPGVAGILDVAIANKLPVEIECLGPDATSTRFVLEPKALSNGRLRGIEVTQQMERTIPVSSITAIQPAAQKS